MDAQDMQNLFKSIDLDLSGEISYDEFLRVVVGDMNQFRRSLVERAFKKLDVNGDQSLDLGEFKAQYNASMHPEVRSGKKTEDQVLAAFMDTFELHLSLVTGSKAQDDDQVTLEEFMEYYNHISVSIDNDAYFDLMISNAWGLEGGTNPASMPYAGVSKKVARVNAREAYRQDHHRNLFGTDGATPFAKGQGQHWQSASHSAMGGQEAVGGNPAAGSTTFYNQDAYRNQFASASDAPVDYSGIRHKDDELIKMLRAKLASRGARGLIGLQRVFKILDDDGDGELSIQELWKGLTDFRLKVSEDECRRLFDLLDTDDSGSVSIGELLTAVKGEMTPFRREFVKRAFKKLDINENGQLDPEDIKEYYNAKAHPEVKDGKKTEQEVMMEFLETFEAHRALSSDDPLSKKGDGLVTLNEFMDYYSHISASIDNDDYFQLMITNAWNLNNRQYSKAVRMEF